MFCLFQDIILNIRMTTSKKEFIKRRARRIKISIKKREPTVTKKRLCSYRGTLIISSHVLIDQVSITIGQFSFVSAIIIIGMVGTF